MKRKILALVFDGILDEEIIPLYHDYLNNTLKCTDSGNAQPTSRLLPNSQKYEEWSDNGSFNPNPFPLDTESIYIYWIFDKSDIEGLEPEDYPWDNSDHFVYDGYKFFDLKSVFEYIIKNL